MPKFAKQFLLQFVLCLLILAGVLKADFDSPAINENLNATLSPDHIVLSWTGDPKTTQTITWRSSTAVNSGEVRYREADDLKSVFLSPSSCA